MTSTTSISSQGQAAADASVQELVERARVLAGSGRRILGITGAPGAGKSTLCAALLRELGSDAVLVGMDGFHLANEELVRLGRRDRKGAPDTFDVDGYTALLRRLRAQKEGVIYAPTFNRGIEESIGSAISVSAEVPLVITEGNYLLHDQGGWERVAAELDESWYLDVPADERESRLITRRESFGHSTEDAVAWVRGVDQANGVVVEAGRPRADRVFHLTTYLESTR